MPITKLENLFNPEVLQDGIELDYPARLKFTPLAEIDNTLVGKAGDTITMPAFRYTGDAVEVGENQRIPTDELTHATKSVTVKAFGKAIPYTDEAMLSGYGDPVGEIIKQHSVAQASKMDYEVLDALNEATFISYITTLDSDAIADALALFGEQEPDELYLFVSPKQLAELRKNEDWIKVTDIGVSLLMSGVKGQIWGVNIVLSSRLGGSNFIVAPKAVRLVMKKGVTVEVERQALYRRTVVVSNTLYAAYLYDDSKVVKIVDGVAPARFTVSFNVPAGARAIEAQSVVTGGYAEKPMDSALAQNTFNGWFKDAEFAEAFDFEAEAITADTVVYGKFTAIAENPDLV